MGLALAASALAAPAVAGTQPVRTEVVPYTAANEVGGSTNGPLVATVALPEGPERFAEFTVVDAAGADVLAEVVQDDVVDRFCTSTGQAIPVKPGFPVQIRLFAGRCLDGSPSAVTQGTIEAKFYSSNPSRDSAMQRAYSITAPGSYVGIDPPVPGNVIIANVQFPVAPQSFVSLEIADASGGAVASVVYQGDREIGRFCGATSKPLKVGRWQPFTVDLHVGVCTDGVQSMPTNGVIKASFTKGK
jgi:hypothetical protein